MRVLLSMLATLVVTTLALAAPRTVSLPRYTEEREAAALVFVKKHLPDLLPLLGELKKTNVQRYQQEVCEVFQVSEMLADLQDEPRRYDIELKIWKAENRAHVLVARLRAPSDDEKKKLEAQLRDVARELVELDIQVLELQAEQLDRELNEVRRDLALSRDQLEKNITSRFEKMLDKARKPKR